VKTIIKKKDNFTTVHNSIILDENLSWKAKGLLIYMLSRPAGWKYKSIEIAKNSTDGRDSVRNGLKELVENKYISRKKNSDGSLTYYIFEDKHQNDITDYLEKPKQENPSLEKPETENPKQENPKLDNPSLYKRKNTNNKRIIVIKEYIYTSEQFLDTYEEFKKMRKAIKAPMTERAEKLLLKKLEEMTKGDEEKAIKILEQSILYNWKGIFKLKGENDDNSKFKRNSGKEENYTSSYQDGQW